MAKSADNNDVVGLYWYQQKSTLLMLWLFVVALAVLQVGLTHWHRQLVGQWQGLDTQRIDLQREYGRLMLERSALTAHGRVERVAKKKLNMSEPEEVQVIRP